METSAPIRRLIWVYFWLLLFEGALRKWVLPSASLALLVVRDPVVLLIYWRAYRAGVFPRNLFLTTGAPVAFLSLAAGLWVLNESWKTMLVPFFGFRANFLHLPLLFVIPAVFDARDVRALGRWFLLLALPMAALMQFQFLSPAGHWLNAGAAEGAEQISFLDGKVRASGTFSFVSGPVQFFALVMPFVLGGLFSKRVYPVCLTAAALGACAVAVSSSGSRSPVAMMGLVLGFALFAGLFLSPRHLTGTLRVALVCSLLAVTLPSVPGFGDSLALYTERTEAANRAEGGEDGVMEARVLSNYTVPLRAWGVVPMLGAGLGQGTVVGAVLTTGVAGFAIEELEQELARNIVESGPLLGLAFVLWRVALAAHILLKTGAMARRGLLLPWLLAAACVPNMLMGNLGQTTVLGFTVLGCGLCLAACREPGAEDGEEAPAHGRA